MAKPAQPGKPIDAAEAFKHADAFYHCIDQLHRTSSRQQVPFIAIPLVVLSTFASELFLKCVLYSQQEHTSPIREHLLADLFKDVAPPMQSRIRLVWDGIALERKEILDSLDKSAGKVIPRDLDSNLQAGSDAFRLVRYLYEGGKDFDFTLSDLPRVLRHAILESKPEWTPSVEPKRSLFTDQELAYLMLMQRAGLWGGNTDLVVLSLVRQGIRDAVEKKIIPPIDADQK